MRDRPIFNGHLELELSGLGPCTRPGDSETTGDETRTFPRYLISYGDETETWFMRGLQQSLGYSQLVTVEPVGLSGGLAVMWKDSYSVSILSADKRIIDMEVTFGSIKFFLTCVYGDPVRAKM